MTVMKRLLRGGLAFAIAASVVAPASAATLRRAGLDNLVAGNSTIVVAEVLDMHSYWNENGDFILTDVRLAANEVLKGNLADREFTVTLMGGQVGDTTTLIVGSAELIPGRPYVLFLNKDDLPGAAGVLTVREHMQGAFDIRMEKGVLRAVSQANGNPLVPDAAGLSDAAGGAEGFPFKAMIDSIREMVERPQGARREVQ